MVGGCSVFFTHSFLPLSFYISLIRCSSFDGGGGTFPFIPLASTPLLSKWNASNICKYSYSSFRNTCECYLSQPNLQNNIPAFRRIPGVRISQEKIPTTKRKEHRYGFILFRPLFRKRERSVDGNTVCKQMEGFSLWFVLLLRVASGILGDYNIKNNWAM